MPRFRLTGLLAKIEPLEGTDAVPVVGTDGIQLEEHIWNSIETDYLEQNARDNVAGNRVLGLYGGAQPTGAFAKITAMVAVKGAGVAYADAIRIEQDVLHRIAGLEATVDDTLAAEEIEYSPRDDDSFESATVYAYSSGLQFKLLGCRARITSVSFLAARLATVTYEIMGRLAAMPTEIALPSITYPRRLIKPPVQQDAALTMNAFGAVYRSVNFEMGTELSAKPRGNASGGHAGYEITHMAPHFSAQIDRPVLASFDPWTLRDAATEFAWSLALGSVQYNRFELSGPAGQIVAVPHEESEGLAMVNLRVRCNHSDATAGFKFRYH